MNIPKHYVTDLDRVDFVLAERQRRKEVLITRVGSVVNDRGPRRGVRAGLAQLLDRDPVRFIFSPSGTLTGVTRPFKARWLLRGSGIKFPK